MDYRQVRATLPGAPVLPAPAMRGVATGPTRMIGVVALTNHRLVFSSVGDRSVHRRWMSEPVRSFGVVLYYYGEHSVADAGGADLIVPRKGTKSENFLHFSEHHAERLDASDVIFIVDDDIVMDGRSLERMFEIFDEFDLWLAQPAYLPGSQIRWPITERDPSTLLRFTNFVEYGVTAFRTSKLPEVIDLFAESRAGWGLDMLFSQRLGDPTDRIAIIDDAPCLHPHREFPEMDRVQTRKEMQADGRRLLERHRAGEWLVPVEHGRIARR